MKIGSDCEGLSTTICLVTTSKTSVNQPPEYTMNYTVVTWQTLVYQNSLYDQRSLRKLCCACLTTTGKIAGGVQVLNVHRYVQAHAFC